MRSQGRTLFRKIWDAHLVADCGDGVSLIYVDRHLVNEVTSPQAFAGLREATRVSFPGITAYTASKGFVDVLTLQLAAELGPKGITVNAVAPGAIDTRMNTWIHGPSGKETLAQMQALAGIGQPA